MFVLAEEIVSQVLVTGHALDHRNHEAQVLRVVDTHQPHVLFPVAEGHNREVSVHFDLWPTAVHLLYELPHRLRYLPVVHPLPHIPLQLVLPVYEPTIVDAPHIFAWNVPQEASVVLRPLRLHQVHRLVAALVVLHELRLHGLAE